MNVTLSSFRAVQDASSLMTRRVVVGSDRGMHVAKLGRVGSHSLSAETKAVNRETMEAFRNALAAARSDGAGVRAFDNVLGRRAAHGRSLRVKDIRRVFRNIENEDFRNLKAEARGTRFAGGATRGIRESTAMQTLFSDKLGPNRALEALRQNNLQTRLWAEQSPTKKDVAGAVRAATEWDQKTIADALTRAETREAALLDRLSPQAREEVVSVVRALLMGALEEQRETVDRDFAIMSTVDRLMTERLKAALEDAGFTGDDLITESERETQAAAEARAAADAEFMEMMDLDESDESSSSDY